MRTTTRSYYVEAMQRAIERIVHGLDRAIPLEDLARDAHLSPYHFHRVFRGMVGETPLELTRRLRMERAAWQLAQTDRGVSSIAFGAGYETHEAFTRAFRASFGTAPSGFRRNGSRRFHLAARCGIHFRPDGRVAPFTTLSTGGEDMNVEIRNLEAKRVATVRHIGPYSQVSQAFAKLGGALGRANIQMQQGMAMIGLYYDDPESKSPEELRSDAAVALPDGVAAPEGTIEQHIPAGSYACTVHEGPYDHLGDTWARLLGEWVPASGHRIGDGPSFEIYLNDPRTAAPHELRTEICVPLSM